MKIQMLALRSARVLVCLFLLLIIYRTAQGQEQPEDSARTKRKSSKLTFEVNVDKLKKNLKILQWNLVNDANLKKQDPATRLKHAEWKGLWKGCADLRTSALKAHAPIAGWIWTSSLNCELKLFDSAAKSKSSNQKKNVTQKIGFDSDRAQRLLNVVQALDTQISLLDRGPWKKDLQSYWLKALQNLKEEASRDSERAQIVNLFYRRVEFLNTELERELLGLLQEPFAVTTGSQVVSQKPQASNMELWWEPARKMDYEQVVKILESYFDDNKNPSNFPSAKLLQAKAYLWTGRYEDAKKSFEKLAEVFPLTEEGLEAQFRLGLLQLRLGNPQLAIQTFDKLLATGREKNPLTTRYWRLRALQMTGPQEAFEAERSQIVTRYPFTYFGLKLRAEGQQGRLEFPQIELPARRSVWNFPTSVETEWRRFKELLKVGYHWEAGAEIQEILSVGDAEAYQMWAEFFADVGLDSLALRYSQSAQNLDDRLVAWSFQKKFMPFAYEKLVQEQAQVHKIEPWVIWGVMRQESAFNIKATSTSNAYGLMQLIGPTAQEVAQDLKMPVSVPEDLFVPEKNIPFGARYLAKMKNEFGGHWPLAVASYNAGPTRLKAWLKLRKDTESLTQSRSTDWRDEIWIDELPWNETQNYVKAVMRNYMLYRLGPQPNWTLPPVFWSESDPSQGVSSRRLIEKKSIKR